MARDHHYFVYLMASKPRGTLHVGVTNDLMRRAGEHASGEGGRFTARYGVSNLVWFEEHQYIDQAIAREKAIKKWRRVEKIALIERLNPNWEDLAGGNGLYRSSSPSPSLCHSRHSGNLFFGLGKMVGSCCDVSRKTLISQADEWIPAVAGMTKV